MNNINIINRTDSLKKIEELSSSQQSEIPSICLPIAIDDSNIKDICSRNVEPLTCLESLGKKFLDSQKHFFLVALMTGIVVIVFFVRKFIKDTATCIRDFFISPTTIDKHKLLLGEKRINDCHFNWYLNLGLLQDAYKNTDDPKLKEQIQFLASNYLDKAARNYAKLVTMSDTFESMFQIGIYTNPHYHRASFQDKEDFIDKINEDFAIPSKSPLILTDTMEFEELLPFQFHVMDEANPKKWSKEFSSVLTSHFSKYKENPKEAFKNSLKFPILFDLTSSLGDLIKTEKDEVKEKVFKSHYKIFKEHVNIAIDATIQQLQNSGEKIFKDKSALRKFLLENIMCICRVKIKDFGGIKVLPFSKDLPYEDLMDTHFTLINFIEITGIYLGIVKFRREIFEGFNEHQDVAFAPQGKNSIYFKDKDDLLNLSLFKNLSKSFSSDSLEKLKPNVTILGKSTIQLLHGLLGKISQSKWEELNENPATRYIIQATLYQIKEHLATAQLWMYNDFTKFAQAIELVHCEIATMLELISPYEEKDFSSIYLNQLKEIPEKLKPFVKAGLCKTSVNVFTGINIALSELNPNPVKAYSKGFYYEQVELMGDDNDFDKILANPDIKEINLYAGQFNPNIDIAADFTHYSQRDIAEDLKQIFIQKPNTKHLVVAIDCTIDYFNSTKIYDLLETFEDKIEKGIIKFEFFHSGMKYDMFGMDNYYGSPFYTVDNGAAHWKSFDRLVTEKVYKTDHLSLQWFCLSNEYACSLIDDYRRLMFQNTKDILNQVPESLKPEQNNPIRVSTIDDKMEPAFIDIRLTGRFHKIKGYILMVIFFLHCLFNRIKFYSRPSFGFYHQNFRVIEDDKIENATSIRITPGLNPEENQIVIDYLKIIAGYN